MLVYTCSDMVVARFGRVSGGPASLTLYVYLEAGNRPVRGTHSGYVRCSLAMLAFVYLAFYCTIHEHRIVMDMVGM